MLFSLISISFFVARRRVAAKRKKMKHMGKSKSTDTEDEDADEDCGDEGEYVLYGFFETKKRFFSFFHFYTGSEGFFFCFVRCEIE